LSSNSAGAGGGVYNEGTLNVSENSILSSNSASSVGGGIDNEATATVSNSTLSGNTSTIGGGIYNTGGGVGTTSAGLTLANSTLSGNTASNLGGGIYNTGELTLTNTTLSGNAGNTSGGGGVYTVGTANITNCTLASNSTVGSGGGIFNAGTFNIRSSIVALNQASSSDPDVSGAFASQGFNLIGKTDGSTGFTAVTDQTGTTGSPLDPKLDPAGLQDNGGPTKTIALLSNSPAIDKGDDSVLGSPLSLTTDQRGYPRKIGAHVDVGAFEYEFGGRLHVISIAHSGNDIVITFEAIQGVTYRLERELNITDAAWSTISGVNDLTAASSGPAQFTDPGGISLGNAFYHVLLLQ
jgi:hypothetical protein